MPADPVQRRLAAILAADVAGYSRLMGEDEEGTHTAFVAHYTELIEPCIAEHRGRVVKNTGDGLLAEFASVVEAVRCAVAFQEGMAARNAKTPVEQRIEFRIGVNLGDVIVQGGDVFGDGVIVAARLEGLAEPGGVVVSGGVHEQVHGKVDAGFNDLGPQQVKNIAEPVFAFAVAKAPIETPGTPLALPDKPSIAVLPFDNMSGDPEQAYFADGITEDIITELSRFRSLLVIARNSSFAFRDQPVDVSEIGRRLGVQFLVEGSVRKSGHRVRVTVQLVDAIDGHHLWAERYDRELEDIFDVQDQITQSIVSTLPGRLEEAGRERIKRKSTTNVTAYDYVLLGLELFKRNTLERQVEARKFFQKAVELDPHFARAHAMLGSTHIFDIFMETPTPYPLPQIVNIMQTALALDDQDSWSHAVLGVTLFMCKDDKEAEQEFRRAIALNPNDADSISLWANILVYLGRWQDAFDLVMKAKRLNPFPPHWYHWYHGLALFSGRDYDAAIDAFKQLRPQFPSGYAYIAACHAYMNRAADAQTEIDKFVEAARGREGELYGSGRHTIEEIVNRRAERYRNLEDRNHFLDGLRKAGLPE